jgi:hypothetical protein
VSEHNNKGEMTGRAAGLQCVWGVVSWRERR